MAKKVSNMNELQKALMPAMVNMTDTLAERVYGTLKHFYRSIITVILWYINYSK